MKKITAFLLALSMVFALAACGEKTPPSTAASHPDPAPGGSSGQSASDEIDWPTKPVTVVVPYSAGGDTDTYARAACTALEKKLGQPFVVVNTTGGSGIVASEEVRAADPDGYTLLFHHTGASLVHEAMGKTSFSFTDDFLNVCTVARATTYTMVVPANSGWNTLEEFVAYCKDHPGEVRYSNVFGSNTHFQAMLLQEALGVEFNLLDVGTGASDRVAAFLGKQVDVLVIDYMNVGDYIENGDMIALGVCAEERVPGMEDIPTFKEQGYDVQASKNYEFRFPVGTDQAIADKLSAACKDIVQNDADFAAALAIYCAYPFYRDAETMMKENRAETSAIKEKVS